MTLTAVCVAALESAPHLATRYERGRLAAGELWRLVSGHFAHLDPRHLVLNLAGLWALAWLFRRVLTPLRALVAVGASLIAIDAGLYLLAAELDWYVGLSGVLHGIWSAAALAALAEDRWLGVLTLGLLVAKLLVEQIGGALPFAGSTILVVTEAHLFGAAGGAVAAACWQVRRWSVRL